MVCAGRGWCRPPRAAARPARRPLLAFRCGRPPCKEAAVASSVGGFALGSCQISVVFPAPPASRPPVVRPVSRPPPFRPPRGTSLLRARGSRPWRPPWFRGASGACAPRSAAAPAAPRRLAAPLRCRAGARTSPRGRPPPFLPLRASRGFAPFGRPRGGRGSRRRSGVARPSAAFCRRAPLRPRGGLVTRNRYSVLKHRRVRTSAAAHVSKRAAGWRAIIPY